LLKNQKHAESSTLFVGNLPFDATEEGLRDLVEGNAAVKKPARNEGDEANDDNDDEGEGEGDDDEKEDEADKEEDEADAEEKAEQAHRGGQRSGLRKVRLGAFQDTGRCKG
jgi:RNA recognition motif-containing protein